MSANKMKATTNAEIQEQGLDDVFNIATAYAASRLKAGAVCSIGHARLASRALDDSRKKVSLATCRYFVVENSGRVWPVEIGRLRVTGEKGHCLPPLGSQRLPVAEIANLAPQVVMKLDVGQRALTLPDGLAVAQEVFPLLGWQAEFERVTIHYDVKAAPVGQLLLIRRTA